MHQQGRKVKNRMSDQRAWIADLLILTSFLGLFFCFQLGRRALWSPDEGRYSEIPREMLVTGDYITPRLNGVKYFEKPPLFYWLQSLSIRFFGLSEHSLRLWTALFTLAGCLVVYVAGRKFFDRRTGLIAAIVLASSPLYFSMGRIITLDMAVSILLTVALLSFLFAAQESPGRKQRFASWAFYFFSALATMTKGLIGVVIPALVIGSWLLVFNEWRLLRRLRLPSGLALFFVVVVPWHILVAGANPEFLSYYFIHEHFQRYLAKHHGLFYRAWFFIPVLLLGFFPWTGFLLQAIQRARASSPQERKTAVFFILWAGWVFLFFSISSSKLIPYILPAFPPLALLVGRYFAAIGNEPESKGFRTGCWPVAIVALAIAGGVFMAPRYFSEGFAGAAKLAPFQYALGSLLALGSLATLWASGRRSPRAAFCSLALVFLLALVVVDRSLPIFDQRRSVKHLAAILQSRLKPEDEVANYQIYYQDLPVYLQRRITLVDWKGELDFGSRIEDVSGWMIDRATFWRRWSGPNTLYVIAPLKHYPALRAQAGEGLTLLAQTERDVLLSNRAPGPMPRQAADSSSQKF